MADNKSIKLEDLVGEDATNAVVETEYQLKKKYQAVINKNSILQDKIAEYNNRLNQLLAFEEIQRETDPTYDIYDYKNASDIHKFKLRWFHYEDSMAKRRGDTTNFVISGVTYHLNKGQDTLVLEEHYALLKNWASQNNFNQNPYNINNLFGRKVEDIAKLKADNPKRSANIKG